MTRHELKDRAGRPLYLLRIWQGKTPEFGGAILTDLEVGKDTVMTPQDAKLFMTYFKLHHDTRGLS